MVVLNSQVLVFLLLPPPQTLLPAVYLCLLIGMSEYRETLQLVIVNIANIKSQLTSSISVALKLYLEMKV